MSESDRISEVRKIKDNILRHTTLLSSYLERLFHSSDDERKNIKEIKTEIRTIIKELSLLKGFCTDKGKEQIKTYSEIGSQMTIPMGRRAYRSHTRAINYWATMINALELNYDKYPFEITGGLEVNNDIF